MPSSADNWVQYWDGQSDMGDQEWRKNMEIFLAGIRPFMSFQAEDRVLDIGSGPGYLAHFIHGQVRSVHCLETSRRYVEEGRRRFRELPNVVFHLLGENYVDLSCVAGERFSRIVCASVVQYYRDVEEVGQLIAAVKPLALPGARMVITDIAVEHRFWRDLVGLLSNAWRQRFLLQVLRFMVRSAVGPYGWMRRKRGLLIVRPEALDEIVARLGLRGEWIAAPLTMNASRRHYLIQF